MYQTKKLRTKYNPTIKNFKQITTLLNEALAIEVKDVYVKVNPLRTNAWDLGNKLYQLVRALRKRAEYRYIHLEAIEDKYVAFWWLWEDEWPDDWYGDHPKYPPSYYKMRFPNSWDNARFLLDSINAFMDERLNYVLHKHRKMGPWSLSSKGLNDLYETIDECLQAFYHFLNRWEVVNNNWGSKYSRARLIGWNIDYDD